MISARTEPGGAGRARCLASCADRALVEIWRHQFAAVGLDLDERVPESLSEAQAWLAEPGAHLLVAWLDDVALARGELSPELPLRQVTDGRLAVIASRPPTAAEQEALRRQGVLAILGHTPRTLQDELLLWELSRAAKWFSAEVENVGLAELLTNLASDRRSVLVSVTCPHTLPLSAHSWESVADPCTSGLGPTRCSGWTGRLYLQNGELLHAETPQATGAAALARMLDLERGSFRVCELSLAPAEPNLRSTVRAALATVRGVRLAPEPAEDEVVDRKRSAMKILDAVMGSSPGLLAAVAEADPRGNVVDTAGGAEFESLCATVVMAKPGLEGVIDALGLGPLRAWSFTFEQGSLFVHQGASLVIAQGGPTRSPEAVLKKLVATIEGGKP